MRNRSKEKRAVGIVSLRFLLDVVLVFSQEVENGAVLSLGEQKSCWGTPVYRPERKVVSDEWDFATCG